MSFRVLKISIALFFCIAGFTTCKKYPEDDKLSHETAKKRLVHKWQLKECTVNEEEKIGLINTFYYVNPSNGLNDSVVYSLRDLNLEIKYYTTRINGKKTKVYDVYYSVVNVLYTNTCICSSNKWEFTDNKRKLKFSTEFKVGFGYGLNAVYLHLLYNETNNAWDIIKLTDKEMVLETMNSNNQKINLKFNRL